MSYDLYFLPRGDLPPADAFSRWFASRRFYEVQGSQAVYCSQDTGAYFVFETADGDDEADPEDPASGAWASFNINYGRPRFFAREAERELAAFCEEFGVDVFDPQDGDHHGAFDAARFSAAWNRTNAFAYGTFAAKAGESFPVAGDLLDSIWEWNYRRDERTRNQELFVPMVQFLLRDGRLSTFTVWPGGIPGAVPRTELVVVVRDRPGASPDAEGRTPTDMFVIPFSRAEAVLDGVAKGAQPIEHWRPGDGVDEHRVVELFTSLRDPVAQGTFHIVPFDRIRDLGAVAAPAGKPSFWRRLLGG